MFPTVSYIYNPCEIIQISILLWETLGMDGEPIIFYIFMYPIRYHENVLVE